MSLLDSIQSPKDLKKMNRDELEQLCSEIRDLLVQTVSHNGGHLASNLGVVELTVALHRVFNSPSDPIIFDVGHQCYTHKILTGRKDDFVTLRTEGGISGFTRPDESEHDIFSSGHSSTAISQAIGLAKAKALRKYAEPIINRAKDDTTNSRRVVFSYLQNKHAVSELFGEIANKIADRNGGYTRIIKTGNRLGDNAKTCFIELVDFNENMLKTEKKKATRTRRSRKSSAAETAAPAVETPAAEEKAAE